jgi:thiamine-monophosphate kinase
LLLTETDIIARIQRSFPGGAALLDDCGAIPAPQEGEVLLATTDLMESGQHFRLEWHPPKMLGRKLLNVNLSDLDSSGARPLGFMLTLAVGKGIAPGLLDMVLEGIAEVAREHSIPIIGGDTVGRETGLGLGATAFGAAKRRLHRNGVQEGDNIYVDQMPGASSTGLNKLMSGSRWDPGAPDPDILAHLDPSPEIGLGAMLASFPQVHACIDVSDGLCKDLRMLAEASGVSIVVATHLSDAALYGGEDYSRCFSSPLSPVALQGLTGRPFHCVAAAVPKAGAPLLRVSGRGLLPVEDRSFEHMSH